jgi:leucyl-tRNA---protein transferase
MHRPRLTIFDNIAFNPTHIEDYVPMQPLDPMVFDRFCADGWCYWSDLLFRRNYWEWRGHACRVILLRIRLDNFQFSKSQRKCLRRNRDLTLQVRNLKICQEHVQLFHSHAERLRHNRPMMIEGFFSQWSHMMPSTGLEFDVFMPDERRLVASSFFHVGHDSMAGNYGIFDPELSHRSLGTYTMLLEILYAQKLGLKYYYPGFVYDLPSEFDYKLNFNNLEYFDWWGSWYPIERLSVREWRDEWSSGDVEYPDSGDHDN